MKRSWNSHPIKLWLRFPNVNIRPVTIHSFRSRFVLILHLANLIHRQQISTSKFHKLFVTMTLKISNLRFLQMLDYVHDQETNRSHKVDDFMSMLKKITQLEFFEGNVYGKWNRRFSVPFSLVPTKHGFCFNFNLELSDSLMHLEK